MRRLLLLLAAASAACASGADDVETGAGAATSAPPEPTGFAFSPGKERTLQHTRGSSDIAATQKLSIDFQNAYWLARLSAIAYESADEIRASLAQIGLPSDNDHFRFFENSCTDTQAFYVSTEALSASPAVVDSPFRNAAPGFAALVFRGTEVERIKDITTDLFAWNRPGASTLGSVHAGFAGALESVWSEPHPECGLVEPIQPLLAAHHQFDFADRPQPERRGAELYFAGHSLGGALATLALGNTITDPCAASTADACGTQFYVPVSGLFTYGAPRTLDRTFANTLARTMQDRTPIFRLIHDSDPVPFVPGFPFAHPGFDGNETDFQVYLDADEIIVGERVQRFHMSTDIVADHLMGGYSSILAARLDASGVAK